MNFLETEVTTNNPRKEKQRVLRRLERQKQRQAQAYIY